MSSLFGSVMGAAAGSLINIGVDAGTEYLKGTEFYKNIASSGFGQAIKSGADFLGIEKFDLGFLGEGLATGLTESVSDKFDFSDMPATAAISATSLAAGRMSAAGQVAAPSIPLGSGNRVPNMLSKPGVRSALQRIQTVPIPRSNIRASASTINLSSAKVSSRYRRKR
tara:strand:+ start:173 stop:676 length:504 start_codon:yes stop_codon:yes gene_type:complete